MKYLILSLFSFTFAMVSNLKVSKLKSVHSQRYPVVYQTEAEVLKNNYDVVSLKRLYIAKLSPSRYEYGAVYYRCSNSQCRRTQNIQVIGHYRICYGFSASEIPICRGPYKTESVQPTQPDTSPLSPKDRMHLDDETEHENDPDSDFE